MSAACSGRKAVKEIFRRSETTLISSYEHLLGLIFLFDFNFDKSEHFKFPFFKNNNFLLLHWQLLLCSETRHEVMMISSSSNCHQLQLL